MANPKHAIVTGGTQGIGLAIAQGLAANGYLVRAIGLEASSDLHHEAITFVEMDVTDDVAVDDLLSGTESLDTLVNAAGIIARQEEFELKTFTRVLNVNLTAAMRLSTAARSALIASQGQHCEYRIHVELLWRRSRAGLLRIEGRRGPAYKVSGDRLGRRPNSRQCDRSRMDRNADDRPAS